MGKVKKILLDTILYWLQIIVFIWPSFFIGNGVVGLIVRVLANNSNNFAARIADTVASVLVLCALLFIFAYRRGYKKGKAHPVHSCISLILAAGLQLAYASLFRYAVYTTAGAYYLAHMLHAGRHQELTFAYYDVPARVYILAMCMVYGFYIVAAVGGEILGKRKRLRDRAALRMNEKD